MTLVHVLVPRGYYLGQTRRYGHRLWNSVTSECETMEAALAEAATKSKDWHRLRVLFIDNSGWYEPTIQFEGKK